MSGAVLRVFAFTAGLLVASVLPATAGGASLFTTAVVPQSLSRSVDARAAQQRFVKLAPSVLAGEVHDPANDLAADRVARSVALPGEVSVELFHGQNLALHRTAVTAASEGGVIWQATVDGGGYAVMVVVGDRIAGAIEQGGHRYLIDPAPGGLHAIREVNTAAYPKDKHVAQPASATPGGAEAPTAPLAPLDTTTPVTINLLVAYTAAAQTMLTSGGATVDQMVDRDIAIMNQGLTTSSVPIRIRKAGVTAVSTGYNENTSDPYQPLYDVTSSGKANFTSIRQLRSSVTADLVAMYIRQKPGHYCGVAWVNGPTPQAAYGFGVVDAYCAGTVSLAHELGHTMGLRHDRYVEGSASSSVYRFGYVSVNGNFRDIMSYGSKCYAKVGHDCPVYTYYSSPAVIINSVKGGIPKGSPGAADAARWLGEKALAVSAFR